ncbi:YifB family Mg chelatase-like AAA ATPase [Thermoanaerobacterium sp. DL9XJH110]|uniref:YifB family Mg chelatase-like AAA ATPase n=1 Tax=Thermoanaerobacterium sp. DL9XJH110 TaxID=3386643 RepID=UPI003BB51F6B
MLAQVKSCAIYGLESFLVDVEVDISSGLPAFDIVGLPDMAVKESRERVRAAIKNQNFDFPVKRITLNLAPADIKKEGPHFDLPIALGILAATEQLPAEHLKQYAAVGELSLDGKLRPVSGILPMAIEVKEKKLKGIMVPRENAEEAAVIQGIDVIGINTLEEAVGFLRGELKIKSVEPRTGKGETLPHEGDFSEVKGQWNLKRCLEIAAAGHHNVIMVGPPGSGKTMVARRIPSILPSMTFEESLELTKIYSIAGLLSTHSSLIEKRPFRAPHHSISAVGMVGGGRIPKPGEVTLAHYGVLFLDELPEFPREILELLRQPLEDGKITISRLNAAITYPAKFMLVAAMNPCPCGFFGDPFHECSCAPYQIQRYLSRISGPLMDRIDLQVEVAPVKFADFEEPSTEDSAAIKKRVEAARLIQLERYEGQNIYYNSQLTPNLINRYCRLGRTEKLLMKEAFHRLKLSARAYNRILKVARTIADLDGAEAIGENHIAEALRYRNIDKYYNNLRL